jgi:hypothetical protein
LVVAFALGVPSAALAHHSGLYDETNIVAIEGTIAAIDWINPHVRLTVEVEGPDGGTASWQVEGTSINALERWGVAREWFAMGAHIAVKGPASRFGRNAMVGATAQLADGRSVLLWPNVAARVGLADTGGAGLFPPPVAAAPAQPSAGIFKVWTPRSRPRNDPAALPLRDSARDAAALYQPLTDDPALECIAPGMPSMLDTPYPIELIDRGEHIVMRLEEWDAERTIHMNPGRGPPSQEPSPYGVSFGRWEGQTLAVFTLYIDYPYFDDLGTPQSPAVTVLERYTPSEDGTRLDWVITVTDEATFTAPVLRRGFMAFEPGETIKPYGCTLVGAPAP